MFHAMLAIAAVLVLVLALVIVWQRRNPSPFPAALTALLDNPVRRLILPPDTVVQRLALEPGMHVLEIGPGGGLFTDAIVRLGGDVRLICLDVQPAMLRKVGGLLGERAPALVCATASALPFADGTFDRILLVSVLGEVPDRAAALRECARVLSPGGALAVTESLPDPDFIPPASLVREAEQAGLVAGERHGTWPCYTQRLGRTVAGEGLRG